MKIKINYQTRLSTSLDFISFIDKLFKQIDSEDSIR